MIDEAETTLDGMRLLVVKDEFIIAMDLTQTLEDLGAAVVGPAGSVGEALALMEREHWRVDGAVLDVNLREERIYPVADALASHGIPFVFATGYDAVLTPERYADIPRYEKPVDRRRIVRAFARA